MDHHAFVINCLKCAKEERGITIAELARRSAIEKPYLERCFRGERTMKADELVRLCLVLKLSFQQLVPNGLVAKDQSSNVRGKREL